MLQILYFTATWCGPCKSFGPIVEQVSAENPGLITKIDVDAQRDTAMAYQISSVPRVVVLKNGDVVASKSGAMPKSELLKFISLYK